VLETVLALGLVTVTLGTASGQNNVGANAAIARGAYVAAAGLWAGPLTGAAMNPARSLSTAIVSNDWSHLWIYVLAPCVGGALAVGIAWILRGPPTRAADRSDRALEYSRDVSVKALPGGVVHKLPSDLRLVLMANPTALEAWNDITPLARNEFICWVEDAKQKTTRERRIRRTKEELEDGQRRPCCWPGCSHRERTGK
jgi:hypothetical protein